MKLFKKNQVVIYVIALMLVVAGYLNYTTTGDLNSAIKTSSSEEELSEMANIGDAQLVSSNIINENDINKQNTKDVEKIDNEDTKDTEKTDNKNTKDSEQNVAKNQSENTTNNNEVEHNSIETSTSNSSNEDYFTTSKLERNTMYSQMLETYAKVLDSSNSLETQKQSATEEIKKINNLKNSIMICENLIQTKGFKNVVVFVNEGSVSVILEAKELSKENVAQVQNIISRELKVEIENIHISNK